MRSFRTECDPYDHERTEKNLYTGALRLWKATRVEPNWDKESSVIVLGIAAAPPYDTAPIAREKGMMISTQNTKQSEDFNHNRERPDRLVFLLGQDGLSIEQVISWLTSDTAPPPLSRQCAWCGKVTHGSLSGVTLLQRQSEGLRPYLHPGFSHGICQRCLGKYMPRRRHHNERQYERTRA